MGAPTTKPDSGDEQQPTPANAKAKKPEPVRFAVYQFETGSYQFGAVKLGPLSVGQIPDSLELPVDEDAPAVKVFDTRVLADANVERLRKNFLAQKGKV